MMGKRQQTNPKLFYVGVNIDERIPPGHLYRRLAAALRLDGVRELVAHCYGDRGHESIDPVVLLKLYLITYLENVRSERELVRHLAFRLDWLWFCGLDLDSPIPDHSVLSKARRRWGLDVFERLFAHVLVQCEEAGLIEGRTVFADSTLLKANADVRSRVARGLWRQLDAAEDLPPATPGAVPAPAAADATPGTVRPAASTHTPPPPEDTQAGRLPPPPEGGFNAHRVSRTDPDAGTTLRRGRGVTLGYRDHTLTDNRCGVILATVATAAHYDDARLLPVLLDQAHQYVEVRPREVVGDTQYGSRENRLRMRRRKIQAYLKTRTSYGENGHKSWLELLDPHLDKGRAVRLMRRRQHVAEGRFAEAHVRMGHRRCRHRRRWRVQIQCYLVAMAQNALQLTRHRPSKPRKADRIPWPRSVFHRLGRP
jgi:transposase